MNNLEDLKVMINRLEVDLTKFYTKGNKAASIRARKTLQEIKGQAQNIRMDISEVRNKNNK
jgi:hypothetical protein